MLLSRSFAISFLAGLATATTSDEHHPACDAVKAKISSASKVYYPGDTLYAAGKQNYFASNEEDPVCVVEPGTPEDLGKILNVIDATRTPFAVKSGGHAINPGFSSTEGILIYTGRFSQVTYDVTSGTAVIGTGLVWGTVYERLQEYNVTVVGGRGIEIGVGGFLLGGGYSHKTNQYGLGMDSIVGFNLVLPNGTVANVTQSTHSDLFFGLMGGFNNFGVVTDFTMKTFPQTEVWGGQVMYSSSQFDQARAAISNFSVHSRDPKATILPSFINYRGNLNLVGTIFYDGPTPPPGVLDNFTVTPALMSDLKPRPYLDMILTTKSAATPRGSWQMLGVSHFTEPLLKAVEDQLRYWTIKLADNSGTMLLYTIQPFLPNYLSHTNISSAFPTPGARQAGNAPNPLLVYFSWTNPHDDDAFIAAVEESVNHLSAVALSEGLVTYPLALYGNYVGHKTPLVDIYGDNLLPLQALKAKIDPGNVMDLAGGFKL